MAKDKVDAWLSSSKANEIEMIISNNDGMALGALEATKAHGKNYQSLVWMHYQKYFN